MAILVLCPCQEDVGLSFRKSRAMALKKREKCTIRSPELMSLKCLQLNIVSPFTGRALQAFNEHESPQIIRKQTAATVRSWPKSKPLSVAREQFCLPFT
ncbi:hypothetical protein MUK42_14658 [Musa troglodytarum]|uniref:Uncharacterized protein n=1 Tax=Musa troglodytarum TaxID=320322 RepID=A0A9E7HUZ7_9LILI|nr:hypothetical protein MUK42_14658 [Musa troglodytarum]